MSKSLQDTWAPKSICFGCGPANEKGLHIRSFEQGDEVVADVEPDTRYNAFAGFLNGGICGTYLDCHSNWTAAAHLMRKNGLAEPPFTVTAELFVKLKKPTPMGVPLHLSARAVESTEDRATIEATLSANGVVTATCRGVFVAVKPGHPGFQRWE